jgi:hypothetical protein
VSEHEHPTYFGRGTTPEAVRDALERETRQSTPTTRRASRAERDAFFARLAELAKRAEGAP